MRHLKVEKGLDVMQLAAAVGAHRLLKEFIDRANIVRVINCYYYYYILHADNRNSYNNSDRVMFVLLIL